MGVVRHVLRDFKVELALATYKRFQVISNILLFTTVSYTSKELKNRAILSFQNIVCVAMCFLVAYFEF